MRIAITVWNNRISPVFDVAQQLLFVDIVDDGEGTRSLLSLAGMSPQQKVEAIKLNRIEMVLCGAVSEFFLVLLGNNGIKVEPWISGDIDEVIKALMQNRLFDPLFSMPGYRHLRRRCRSNRKRSGNK